MSDPTVSTAPKSYQRLRLRQVDPDLEEDITELSFSHGATGLSEALAFKQPNLQYEPTILYSKTKDFDVYFDVIPGAEYFQALRELAPQVNWEVIEEENKDWLEEWKKGFNAFQLAGPYWIVPSWLPSPVEEQFAIHIDPGMAFGTGTHATTQMASSFLHRKSKEAAPGETLSMLDVGTGTAVLAILARKLGMQPVIGLEIDPEARRVARENIERNQTDLVEVLDQPLEELKQSFDVVVANIIDGVLIALRKELLAATKTGGDLFLTGILLEREEIFLERFVRVTPVEVVKRWQHDDWVGYWVKKVAP